MAAASKGGNLDDVDRDGKLPVLSTSVNAFAYIKNSIGRCTKVRRVIVYGTYTDYRVRSICTITARNLLCGVATAGVLLMHALLFTAA
jgi:hypothetical protein